MECISRSIQAQSLSEGEALPRSYLTKNQLVEKYPFLTKNRLKNLLFRDRGGFRNTVVRKLGRRILLDEEAFLKFLSETNRR